MLKTFLTNDSSTSENYVFLSISNLLTIDDAIYRLKSFGIDCSVGLLPMETKSTEHFYLGFNVRSASLIKNDYKNLKKFLFSFFFEANVSFLTPDNVTMLTGDVFYESNFLLEPEHLLNGTELLALEDPSLWTDDDVPVLDSTLKNLAELNVLQNNSAKARSNFPDVRSFKIYKDFELGKELYIHQYLAIFTYFKEGTEDVLNQMKDTVKHHSWATQSLIKWLNELSESKPAPMNPRYFSPYTEDRILYENTLKTV